MLKAPELDFSSRLGLADIDSVPYHRPARNFDCSRFNKNSVRECRIIMRLILPVTLLYPNYSVLNLIQVCFDFDWKLGPSQEVAVELCSRHHLAHLSPSCSARLSPGSEAVVRWWRGGPTARDWRGGSHSQSSTRSPCYLSLYWSNWSASGIALIGCWVLRLMRHGTSD